MTAAPVSASTRAISRASASSPCLFALRLLLRRSCMQHPPSLEISLLNCCLGRLLTLFIGSSHAPNRHGFGVVIVLSLRSSTPGAAGRTRLLMLEPRVRAGVVGRKAGGPDRRPWRLGGSSSGVRGPGKERLHHRHRGQTPDKRKATPPPLARISRQPRRVPQPQVELGPQGTSGGRSYDGQMSCCWGMESRMCQRAARAKASRAKTCSARRRQASTPAHAWKLLLAAAFEPFRRIRRPMPNRSLSEQLWPTLGQLRSR